MGQVIQTPDQHYYYYLKLLGNDCIIVYKPGKTNKAANALSRKDFLSQSQILILSTPSIASLNQLV